MTPILPTPAATAAALEATSMADAELPADQMLDAIAHVYDEDETGDLK